MNVSGRMLFCGDPLREHVGEVLVSGVVPRLPAPASPGNLLEMPATRPHSVLTESETLGVVPSNLCFTGTSR